MAQYKNIIESGVIAIRPGVLNGFIVATHSSGTLQLIDGQEDGVAATNDLTSSGAMVAANHGSSVLTSSGATVAATHATATLTSGGTNFLDDVKASLVLTAAAQVTAADTVTVDGRIFTFRAIGDMNDPTDVLIGADEAATMINLQKKLGQVASVTAVLTTSLTITVTAITAGTAGNAIVVAEAAAQLSWTAGGTVLAGGLAAETVTIGTTVYTFRKEAVTSPYEVVIGSTLTISLANLKNAINGTRPPIGYNQETAIHESVVAFSSDATTIVINANVVGASLNALATTETCVDASWGDTTLVDGVATTLSTVTVGANVYTQVDVLSETLNLPAVANQFLRGASEATMLDAFKTAINATSLGTLCSTGTVAHPYFIATTNTNTAQTIVSRVIGNAAFTAVVNALATEDTLANTIWTGATYANGVQALVTSDAALIVINGRTYTATINLSETSGADALADQVYWVTTEAVFLDNLKSAINASGTAGTEYSTGTTENVDVRATTNTNTVQTIESKLTGTIGNSITTTESMANYAWDDPLMTGGTKSTGSILMGVITFPAVTVGTLTYNFPAGLSFVRGLYAVIGGTSANITIQYN